MMTRASRLLKWIGAGSVVLAVAPIAYTDAARHTATPSSGAIAPESTSPRTSPSTAPDTSPDATTGTATDSTPGGAPESARCESGSADFAGTYTVAGRSDVAIDFHADGGVSELYLGARAATGTWHATGDAIVWTAGGVTYTSVPHTATCADPSHAARVTSLTATPSADPLGATGATGSLGADPLTLERF